MANAPTISQTLLRFGQSDPPFGKLVFSLSHRPGHLSLTFLNLFYS